ncbi:MAG TPA: hypothetical protein VIQ28_01055 [Burkholderiales bacterium]
MKMSLSALDGEIVAVERAIAADRKLLEQAFVGYVENVRETAVSTIASPKFLLGALGVGFIAGKFLFRGRKRRKGDSAPVKSGVLGLLGAGALSLAQAQFGGPVGLVRWITTQIYQFRRSARHAAATRQAMPQPAVMPVDDLGYTGTEEPPAALLRR